MAVRTDVTVDFLVSPRLIEVAAPSVDISIQDLYDTLREIEDDLQNLDDDFLISAGGKESLGGSLLVGITATLNNAQLLFEARRIVLSEGTVTSSGSPQIGSPVTAGSPSGPGGTGIFMQDSTATFLADGVARGDIIFNCTDLSSSEIISVSSETSVKTRGLGGGTNNRFESGDQYAIYDVIQCEISGGNLVGLGAGPGSPDIFNDDLDPVFPTFGTQVIRTGSSSATIVETGISGLTAAEAANLVLASTSAADTWDELLTNHTVVDSFGEAIALLLNSLGSPQGGSPSTNLTVANITQSVWNALGSDFPIGSPISMGGQITTMYSYIRDELYIDTSLATNGDGRPDSPFNNFTSAVDEAESSNITRLILLSDATADRNLRNFEFVGRGNPAFDLGGFNVHKSEFLNLRIDGDYTGSISARQCELAAGLTGLSGEFHFCGLFGAVTMALNDGGSPIAANEVLLHNCYSHIPGLTTPEINVNGAASNQLVSVRNYSGGLIISNSVNAGNEVTVEMAQGRLFLAASNTAGTISVRGLAFLSDLATAAGATVETTALLEPVDIKTILTFTETLIKFQANRSVIDKAAFTLTIYDNDDVTPIRVFDLRELAVGPSITEITERLPASGSPLTP